MNGPVFCRVRVRGSLGAAGRTWFEGLSVTTTPEGNTLVAGRLPDQSSLHGLLDRVRDLGLELISVEATRPDESQQSDVEV